MGSAAPVLRASARSATPPAPTSQTCSGSVAPKPRCVPQPNAAAINRSSAGAPSRKKAAKLTTTSASIKARVATSPASAAAATVTPFTDDGPEGASPSSEPDEAGWAAGAAVAALTSDHECQPALDVITAATPAGATASSRPATMAAALRRNVLSCSHTRRRRTRPTPVSINRSRSKVAPQRIVSAKHATSGNNSEADASGERNTKSASGRSATAAETGDSRNDHAPPAAPSRGNSMKPSIRPIAAQYDVTAATNANAGRRSHGAGWPKKLSSAIPAAIHSVTHTVLTTAPGSTSSQIRDGSSSGV